MQAEGLIKDRGRLEALSKYEILDSAPEPAFNDLTALAAQFCETPISLLTFVDDRRQWVKAKTGTTLTETACEVSFCAHAISEPFMVVTDARLDERFSSSPLVTSSPHIRFYAGSPLLSREGHPLGTLCVMDWVPREINFEQRQMLQVLCREAMALLEMRRDVNQTRRRNERQRAELRELSQRLGTQSAEHRQIEARLRRRERQLEDAQRMAHLGSWEWDVTLNKVTWSAELYRIFGFQPKQFKPGYDAYLERIHPDDRERSKSSIEGALRDHKSFASTERILRSDGATRLLATQGEVISDQHDRPIRMVGCCQDITEQKEFEHKLETSVSLLNATLESTTDGIIVVDRKGVLVRYNHQFLKMWHLTPGMVELRDDKRTLALVLEQLKSPEAFLAKVNELYAHPEVESFDVLEFKDGRIFERYSKPQRLRENVVGRVWSFRDVTDRYRALKTLRRSEERYRSLVIATSQIVWTTNAQGEVTDDIPTWREFTGQKVHEILGFGWLNAIHPKDRQKTLEIWSHALTTVSLYETEYRLLRADGEWRHMRVRGVPILDKDQGIREWVGFCYDISERKHAEQILVRERDFSETIINSLPGIFYLLDETGLNLRWNKNLETVTEYSGSEISEMHASDFVPEEERAMLKERMQKVFSSGQAEVELTLVTKTGKRLPYYCTGRLVNFDGKPCLVGMGIDISTRTQAEQRANKLNEDLDRRVRERTAELKTSNKELEAFSYTVSHDLRAPIRAIRGFVEAIDEDCRERLDQEDRIYLDRIKQAGERMTHLIEDLLTYSRIGRLAPNLRSVPLNEIVREIADNFTLRLRAIGGRLLIDRDLPQVRADQTLLGQVFANLFENAINYRKKDLPLEMQVTAQRDNGRVIVRVIDNGIGISSQHYEKIFEVFQRLHKSDEIPGTGIGLASVKKSIESLGGRIWVESEVDKGSTFLLELPSA
ncbi:MAG: multi-sensor signal transduction histidine kinase [Verrucomicrobiales bacterium]|nr:multi-sensor signal transduction histidine kinase [Verrucomicrobiales bacterium]